MKLVGYFPKIMVYRVSALSTIKERSNMRQTNVRENELAILHSL